MRVREGWFGAFGLGFGVGFGFWGRRGEVSERGVEVLTATGWLWRDGCGARGVSRRWEGLGVLRVTVTLVAWGGLEVGVLDLSGGGKRAWPGVVVGGGVEGAAGDWRMSRCVSREL